MSAMVAVIHTAAGVTAGRYTTAAAITVVLYDILITLGDEVALVWPTSLSLVKVLYLMNRYIAIPCLLVGAYHVAALRAAPSVSEYEHNRFFVLTQVIGQTLGLITAVALLLLRVRAMYSGDWRISVLLYVVYLASFTFIIVEEVMYMHDLWPSFIYSSLLGVCLANPSRRLALMFFAPVFCDVLLVILQLIHAFRTAMLSGSLINTAPLLKALYKDGFIYFMAVFSLRLWSACLFSWGDSAYWYTSTYLEFALTSISASRLTLHLRKVAKRGITPPTSHLTGASLTTDSSSPERYGARKISPWTFPWTDRGDDTTTGTELTSYERGKSRHEAPLHEALEP